MRLCPPRRVVHDVQTLASVRGCYLQNECRLSLARGLWGSCASNAGATSHAHDEPSFFLCGAYLYCYVGRLHAAQRP